MNWIALTSETPDVVRDPDGIPLEWTLLHVGGNPLCQEGKDGILRITPEDLTSIVDYFTKKGEEIPVDSEHYLFALAESKGISENGALAMFPGGVAALGFGKLFAEEDKLRIRVKWTEAAREMLKGKIYKYFSPVIRGLEKGPLRVTSVAMTNTPAINKLDALAARAETNQPSDQSDQSDQSDRKESMSPKLEAALKRLTGRDVIALESEPDKDKIACEVEEKASLIEQVKTLLGLPPEAGLEEVIAALKAETEKAKTADEKQKELDDLKTADEKEKHAALVEKGRQEGKITDADTEYVNSLDSKALSAHLAHCPVKLPRSASPAARRAESPADTVALTAEDIAACNRLGLNREEFLKTKKERMN